MSLLGTQIPGAYKSARIAIPVENASTATAAAFFATNVDGLSAEPSTVPYFTNPMATSLNLNSENACLVPMNATGVLRNFYLRIDSGTNSAEIGIAKNGVPQFSWTILPAATSVVDTTSTVNVSTGDKISVVQTLNIDSRDATIAFEFHYS